METKRTYDTVSEAVNDLVKRGYTTDFEIMEDCIVCNKTSRELSPQEFEIDETYRFDGMTDPGDDMIVYGISSKNHDIKGVVINAYGAYSDASTSKIVAHLHNHVNKKKPLKRSEILKPFSREHHHGLLLCWKIRAGNKKNVSEQRIKKYADWFYETQLIPHFIIEEEYIYPILGNDHELIKKAVSEHRRMKRLFESNTDIAKNLSQIEEELERHIRFEERVLFNEIQQVATQEQLELIAINHTETPFVDNMSDPFWE